MNEPAGMWLRVSSTGQDETSQKPDDEKWIESHRYNLTRTYTVHGKSAFKGNRQFDEAWARVITDMANGVISVLVVWKQDRIDRKLNTFRMLEQAVKAGGRVEFVTQPHLNDLTTMGGRIALKVQEEIAYAESKDKSDRVRIKQAALRKAKSLVGRPPFGYRVAVAGTGKTIVPTPEGIKYVPEIFRRAADGETLMSVAKWLDSEGVKPLIWKAWIKKNAEKRGSEPKWSPKSIAQIIRRPTYVGERQDASGITELEVKPLVDAKLWMDANKRLDAAPATGKRGPSVHEQSLLTGAFECARCGAPMYRVYCGRGSWRKPYYRCHGKLPQPKGCGMLVSAQLADAEIDEMMASNLNFVRTTKFIPGDNHDAEIAQIDRELLRLPAKLLPYKEEDAERARLRAERDRLASLPATDDRYEFPILIENGEPVTYASKWQASDIDGQRAMLRENRITFRWDEGDGIRFPRFLMVPITYDAAKEASE
jgi:DNA invertase Pin-like site-specific DNA recombinase